jgi:hypothetical protein
MDNLNNFFNIEETKKNQIEKIEGATCADFSYAKQNLKDIIEQSKIALEGIMRVAMEGDSPRAYEVVTQMLKTMSEINKDYIDLDNIKKESEKQSIKTTNNNSFFIGSTTDLQDLINPERSKKKALEHIIDVEAENDKKV